MGRGLKGDNHCLRAGQKVWPKGGERKTWEKGESGEHVCESKPDGGELTCAMFEGKTGEISDTSHFFLKCSCERKARDWDSWWR